jgi:hypothetical protein
MWVDVIVIEVWMDCQADWVELVVVEVVDVVCAKRDSHKAGCVKMSSSGVLAISNNMSASISTENVVFCCIYQKSLY